MPRLLQRCLAALPDAITAGVLLTAWVAPQRFGPERVRDLTLVMVMEFIVIHSSLLYAILVGVSDSISRRQRIGWLAALSSLYLVIAAGFTVEYRSTWPLLAFAWLFVGRFAQVWTRPVSPETEGRRMVRLWAVSVCAYLAGGFAIALVPVPPLGLDSAFVAAMQQYGGSGWGEGAGMLAFGTAYFSLTALAKATVSGAAAAASRKPSATLRARFGQSRP